MNYSNELQKNIDLKLQQKLCTKVYIFTVYIYSSGVQQN